VAGFGDQNPMRPQHADALVEDHLHHSRVRLGKFRREAKSRSVNFVVHHSEALALDLDEPGDLARLRRAV
jgi:2-phospho-L-lactate guanylyltransferase (CobY/MobA/RfbA family)